MNGLFWTFFLGSDLDEITKIQFKEQNVDFVKEAIQSALYPDTVKERSRDKHIVFRENLTYRYGNSLQPIYFIYKIETSVSEKDLNTLITTYFLETTMKIMNFMTSLISLAVIILFILQNYFVSFQPIIAYNTHLLFALFGAIFIKMMACANIYQDIKNYREKLERLIFESLNN